jgi:ATP-binding cassette subfamily B protein
LTPNARSLRVAAGEIVFEDMSFTYPNSQRLLYQKIKLTIRAGERVGLVGASGAGKTTLVKLLQRYYDIDAGRILVDGQDIALVTLASTSGSTPLIEQARSSTKRNNADPAAARPHVQRRCAGA